MTTFIKRLFVVILLATLVAACTPGRTGSSDQANLQIKNPNPPQSTDGKLQRDTVEIVKTDLTTLNNAPLQVALKISFFTPTPCDQFRINVDQPGADKRINVEVYSLMKPNQACALMRLNTPTEATIDLGKFSTGHYTVWVNNEKALEFDA